MAVTLYMHENIWYDGVNGDCAYLMIEITQKYNQKETFYIKVIANA